VAFDPRNPERSVLDPGPHFDDLLWISGGLMFAVTGMFWSRTMRASSPGESVSTAAASTARPVRHRYRIALILTCISFILMSLGLHNIYVGIRSASWPIVQGRVLFSRTSAPNGSGNHRTEIRYEYFLDGQRYDGAASLVAPHDESFALSRSHRVGAAANIHYDPARPTRSVIQTGLNWHHFMLPLFAFIVMLFALLAKRVADMSARKGNVAR
jgi:hypothetical protein